MKHERIRQIIELLMEILWLLINRKRTNRNESDDQNPSPEGD